MSMGKIMLNLWTIIFLITQGTNPFRGIFLCHLFAFGASFLRHFTLCLKNWEKYIKNVKNLFLWQKQCISDEQGSCSISNVAHCTNSFAGSFLYHTFALNVSFLKNFILCLKNWEKFIKMSKNISLWQKQCISVESGPCRWTMAVLISYW